jgi:hypothetical protein
MIGFSTWQYNSLVQIPFATVVEVKTFCYKYDLYEILSIYRSFSKSFNNWSST